MAVPTTPPATTTVVRTAPTRTADRRAARMAEVAEAEVAATDRRIHDASPNGDPAFLGKSGVPCGAFSFNVTYFYL